MRESINSLRKCGHLKAPWIIQIEITNICPLNCPQCYKPEANKKRFMPFEDYCRHIDEAKELGVKTVVLIGGEPFLHKRILDMISYAIDRNLEAAIFTSGWGLKDSKFIDSIKQYKDKLHLLLSLNASIESINDLSRDGYQITKDAMQSLCQNGVKFGVNWVARHDNVGNFRQMVEFAKSYGAEFINIVCNKINGNGQVDSPLEKADFEYLSNILKNENHDGFITVQKCYDLLILKSLHLPRTALSGCQAGVSICSITCDNHYVPCLHLNYPEYFSSLKEYWEKSNTLAKLRAPKKYGEACSGCKYVGSCRFCRAMSLRTHDDLACGLENCLLREEGA
jgi:MoaA/NifB/PqqE/SkfB family radical SAM enzyme